MRNIAPGRWPSSGVATRRLTPPAPPRQLRLRGLDPQSADCPARRKTFDDQEEEAG